MTIARYLLALAALACACSSSTAQQAAPRSFECLPPASDAGVDVGVDAGPADLKCVVGQSYCRATRARGALLPEAECQPFSGDCVTNPTCACIMPTPNVSCSCAETDGAVVLTCDRV